MWKLRPILKTGTCTSKFRYSQDNRYTYCFCVALSNTFPVMFCYSRMLWFSISGRESIESSSWQNNIYAFGEGTYENNWCLYRKIHFCANIFRKKRFVNHFWAKFYPIATLFAYIKTSWNFWRQNIQYHAFGFTCMFWNQILCSLCRNVKSIKHVHGYGVRRKEKHKCSVIYGYTYLM